MSRTTIIYHPNGDKTVVEGTKRYAASYDSQIDLPMHQRILNGYRDLESKGTLRPHDVVHSKTYTRNVLEAALARES